MDDKTNLNLGSPSKRRSPDELRRRDDFTSGGPAENNGARPEWERQAETEFSSNGKPAPGFNAWPLMEKLLRSWYWLLLGGCILAGVALVAATLVWQTRYTATAQLLRFETPNNSELFKPRPIAEQTFASMMRSPKLLRDVSALAKPAISPERLASSLVVVPERNSDVVSVSITALDPEVAINVANLFATEAVQFSKDMQIEEAKAANVYYTNQLAEMDRDRKVLIVEMQEAARDAARSAIHPSQLTDKFQVALAEKVQAAREELVNLLAKYTDAHPTVKEQRSKIEALQKQLKEMATN